MPDEAKENSVTPVDTQTAFEATRGWLETPLGQALALQEARVIEEVLDGLFGAECLQLGIWGEPRAFLKFARTQRTACLASPSHALSAEPPSAYGRLHRLPIASDCIDVAILPHTLDFSTRPHEILREVHRVLRSDGHLVILGFKPGGLWGLRRLIPGAAMPPHANSLVSDRQLSDWLKLLDLHIHGITPYFFRWPLTRRRVPDNQAWERRGRRWWPELSACYLLAAQKRVAPLTLSKPWRARPKVVAGLAEPTTRVSRIRLDQNG